MPAPARPSTGGDPDGQRTPPSRAELVRGWLVWWAVGAGLWLVLDDTVAVPELVDGAVAAALGASAATLVRAHSHVQFSPRASWARLWWRPLRRLVSDLPDLTRVLVRALAGGDRAPGRVRAIDFSVSPDSRTRAAQVALASVAGSVAPGTVIIAVDEDGDRLIFHELTAREDRAGADPLELG